MKGYRQWLYRPFWIRLLHWEYWSFDAIYIPVYVVWLGLSIRARSFFFFSASNPGIEYGGFLAESKKDIIPLIPANLQPKTAFFSHPANPEIVLMELAAQGMDFPLIGKPDIGCRGRGIKALKDRHDLVSYVKTACLDFHIQEFVPYKKETGIFYYRYPGSAEGHISGIVRKEFLKITGDGRSTIRQLLMKNKRAILQLKPLEQMYGAALNDVPVAGVEKTLVPYGNHARGACFLDDSHLIDPVLTSTIDTLCRQINGFYFGRIDIRYQDWESLRNGQHFSVIEVNGAGSEPTHIYDPRHSIFFAWKEIIRHWIILCRISRINHKKGIPYLTLKQGMQMFREDKIVSEKLAAMPV